MPPDQLRELADRLADLAFKTEQASRIVCRPPHPGIGDLSAAADFIDKCAEQPTRTIVTTLPGLAPTHRCIMCNALWRQCDDHSWNLRSAHCGPCCDNADMTAAHIQPLYAAPAPQPMSDEQRRAIEDAAARDVFAERRRQVEAEGWTPEHDDEHIAGELAAAGASYAEVAADVLFPLSEEDEDYISIPPPAWPWDKSWWKPGDPRRNLVKAGALILAEIERIDRAALAAKE